MRIDEAAIPGIAPVRGAGPAAETIAGDAAPPPVLRNEPVQFVAANDNVAAPGDDPRTQALLAQDVYNDVARPPAGYRVAGEDDLRALNLDASLLSDGSFRARVYVTGEGDATGYSIAFRGSQSADDWLNNAQQGLGLDSAHYRAALAIGERVARSDVAERVHFSGHSLGGGLASAAAIAAGRPADTFNAAGLHQDTIDAALAIHRATGAPSAAQVDSWQVQGEILAAMQDGGDRLLISPFLDLPESYGTRHVLDAVAPDGTGFFDRWNPVARHGIDWVLSSLPH